MGSELSLTKVDSHVPVLIHPSWIRIGYDSSLGENEVIQIIQTEWQRIVFYVRDQGLKQVKISVPWDWSNLRTLGFLPATGRLEHSDEFQLRPSQGYVVETIKDPIIVRELLSENAQLLYQYLPYYFRSDVACGIDEFIEILKEELKKNEVMILGIRDGGKMVATAVAEILENQLEINDIYVIEKYRSKGFGLALLTKLKQLAIDQNLSLLSLYTGYNMDALDFYLHIGFRKVYLSWVYTI